MVAEERVLVYGVKITGPQSDSWAGWAVRNKIDGNGSVFVGARKYITWAEKFHTLEEAEEIAFLLAAQQPHLLGRIKIMKLRQTELDHRWTVEGKCSTR
jgi:hypothetical protein